MEIDIRNEIVNSYSKSGWGLCVSLGTNALGKSINSFGLPPASRADCVDKPC